MDESKFQLFDAAEYLDSEEAIAEYISEAMQDPNPDVLLEALATVARARHGEVGGKHGTRPREPIQDASPRCEAAL